MMNIEEEMMVPVLAEKQNISEATRVVDWCSSVVIMENNALRHSVCKFNQEDGLQAAADDDVLAASELLMQRNQHIYEQLAK